MPVTIKKATRNANTSKKPTRTTRPARPTSEPTEAEAPGVGDVWNFTLDFDQVKGFDAKPAGTYGIKIKKAELGLSKKQLPKVAIEYEITSPEEFDGQKLFDNPSLEPQARFKIKNLVEALGGDTTEIDTPQQLIEFLQEMRDEGVVFGVAVSVDGQKRNQVERYLNEEEMPVE